MPGAGALSPAAGGGRRPVACSSTPRPPPTGNGPLSPRPPESRQSPSPWPPHPGGPTIAAAAGRRDGNGWAQRLPRSPAPHRERRPLRQRLIGREETPRRRHREREGWRVQRNTGRSNRAGPPRHVEARANRPAPPARVLAPAISSALTRQRRRCLRAFSSTGCRRLLPVPGRLSGEYAAGRSGGVAPPRGLPCPPPRAGAHGDSAERPRAAGFRVE